jgi:O-antigen ligase
MAWPTKIIRLCFYLTFILVPIIFLSNTSELFEFNKMIVTYLLTIFIVCSWLLLLISEKKFIFRRTPLDLPILLFLLFQTISLAFSIDSRTSFLGYYSRFNGGLVSLFCYAFLYWAYVTFMDRKSTLKALSISLWTSIVVAVYASLEHFGFSLSCLFTSGTFGVSCWVQDVQDRVFATMGQPNWLAAYLVVLLPVFISLAVSAKNLTRKIIFSISGLLLLITILFTKSQSGIGVMLVILGLYLFLLLLKIRSFKALFSGAAIFLLLIVINFHTITYSFHALTYIFTTKDVTAVAKQASLHQVGGTSSTLIRRIVWQGAVNIWLSSAKTFWLGTGPETFAMAYYQHRPLAHNYTSEWELLYNKAHNEFFNYLATTGILGLVSYLYLLGVMLMILIKYFRTSTYQNLKVKHSPIIDNWPLNLAFLTGWLSISITNFWGFSVVIVQILLFLLPAFVLTLTTDPTPTGPDSRQFSGLQIIGFLAILSVFGYLIFATVQYWVADTRYASGDHDMKVFSATQNGQYIISAYQSLSQAYDLNPHDPPISAELALATAYVSLMSHDMDATTSAQMAETALKLSSETIAKSPFHPNYYINRSQVARILAYVYPQDLEIARESLLQAAVISPTDPRIPYSQGVVAESQGNLPEAEKYFHAALTLKPDFTDPQVQLDKLASLSAQIKQ